MLHIEFLNEKETISFTKHGDDRRLYRDGQPVGISRNEVESIIRSNFKRIMPFWGRFNTVVLKNVKNGLNIVGSILRNGEDWIFRVITIMFKRDFKAHSDDLVLTVNENVMHWESFMDLKYDPIFEIAEEGGELYPYSLVWDEEEDEGEWVWNIKIEEDGVEDEIAITIDLLRNTAGTSKFGEFKAALIDVVDVLDIVPDINSNYRLYDKLVKEFDFRKWQGVSIGNINMASREHGFEVTGYGKRVALKLLRTRFKIIQDWVAKEDPDIFMSYPKKENPNDSRRTKIYQAYFQKYLPNYNIYIKERVGSSSDLLICVKKEFESNKLEKLIEDIDDIVL